VVIIQSSHSHSLKKPEPEIGLTTSELTRRRGCQRLFHGYRRIQFIWTNQDSLPGWDGSSSSRHCATNQALLPCIMPGFHVAFRVALLMVYTILARVQSSRTVAESQTKELKKFTGLRDKSVADSMCWSLMKTLERTWIRQKGCRLPGP
jgi:hypothetical protein